MSIQIEVLRVEDDAIRAQAARTLIETYFKHITLALRVHFAFDEVIHDVIHVDQN